MHPYTIQRSLGTSPYGDVSVAADGYGTQVVLTVLNQGAAADWNIRSAFRAAVDAAYAAGGLVAADPNATPPWAAQPYAGDYGAEALLAGLGGGYQPAGADPYAPPTGYQPAGADPYAPPTGYQPAGADQTGGWAPDQTSYYGPPTSAVPAAEAAPPPPPKKKTSPGVIVAYVAILLCFLLVGGTTVIVLMSKDSTPSAGPTPSAPATTGTRTPSAAPTSASPSPVESSRAPAQVNPGKEPPKPGTWPANWAKFAQGESTYPMKNLEGLGFSFNVPANFGCAKLSNAPVKWSCIDDKDTSSNKVGIIITARDCVSPCDAEVQKKLRAEVNGWGEQWIQADAGTLYVEISGTTNDGTERYCMAMVRYWRGKQIAVTSCGPPKRAPELQKTTNDIRTNLP